MIRHFIPLSASAARRTPYHLARERGASTIEYGILLGLIAAIVMVVLFAFGFKLSDIFSDTSNSILSSEGSSGGGAGGGAGDPEDPEPDTFTVSLKLNNSSQTFLAIGPGQQATVSWKATKAAQFSDNRTLTGTTRCSLRNTSVTSPSWASAEGSQTLAWTPELSNCFYEACYSATPESDPDNWNASQEACVAISFTPFEPAETPSALVTVNGVHGTVVIGPGETATFDWNVTYPVGTGANYQRGSGCPSAPITMSDAPLPSGSLSVAWNAPAFSCQVKVCAWGYTDSEDWSDFRQSCSYAVFAAADRNPDPIVWTPLSNVVAGSAVDSNTVQITGINAPITMTLSSGSTASVNGVLQSGTSITVPPDAYVQLHTIAAAGTASKNVTFNRSVSNNPPLAAIYSSWVVANAGTDQTPSMGSFTSLTNVDLGQKLGSNTVTPSSYNAMPFSVSGGVAYLGTSTVPVTSGWMAPSSSIRLETTAAATLSTPTTVTLNYGSNLSLSRTWTVTTRSTQDTTADPVSFETDYENSNGGSVVTHAVAITGLDTTVEFNSDAQICVNSNACSSGPVTLAAGDTVKLQAEIGSTCAQQTWYLGQATGVWSVCPVEHPGEDYQPSGWCEGTNVQLFTSNGTLANGGLEETRYFGPASAGTWRYYTKWEEYTQTDGFLTFDIDTWAIYCVGGGGWTPVNIRSQITSSGPAVVDKSFYYQSKSNGFNNAATTTGIARMCANLGANSTSSMLQCIADNGG